MSDISKITLISGTTYDIKDAQARASIPTKVSDLTNDSGYITGMTILSYGSSTWADFIEAYNAKKVVYCRASSNSNPASGSQTRLAFMAYVNDATNPTNVEFQYYRSVNTHSASQQGDQTYVYKLDKTAGWTVTVRENYSKIIAGTNMTSSYNNSQITLNATVPTKTSDLTNDSGFVTSADIPEGAVASQTTPAMDGTASIGTETTFARGDHVHPTDTSRASASDLTSLTTRVGTLETAVGTGGSVDTKISTAIGALDSSISATTNEAISAITIADGVITSSSKITVPTNTNQLTNGAGYQTASDVQALITQSDWAETDNTDSSYIANKPPIKSGEGTNSIIEGQLSDYSETVVYTLQITGEANATTYSYTVSLTDPANTALPTGTELRHSAIAVYNSTDCRTVLSLDSTNTTITLNKTLKSSAISGDILMVYYKCKTAIAEESHAEGHMTRAGGKYSHAEGNQSMSGGESSHSEGMYTNAIGDYSHAEGYDTIVRGQAAHAEGWACQTLNYGCHAEGYGSLAWGVCSHAEGDHTTAQCKSQHVFGEYNVLDTSGTTGTRGAYVEIVGKGTADNARSNARTLDWSGNETLAGRLTLGAVPVSNMDAATKQYVDTSYVIAGKKANTTLGNKATAEGNNTTASYAYAHAEGELTQATNYAAHAEGGSSQATGYASHAEGYSTVANEAYSHSEGYSTTASGSCSHAEGNSTNASGDNSHAEGNSTNASGDNSHAEGRNTTASGNNSHAEGNSTRAMGYYSHTDGLYTQAEYKSQHVFGEYNVLDNVYGGSASSRGNYVEIVGNGTGSSARSNARTLDWSGNEVLAGKLTVGVGPTNNMDVATKQYVDSHSSSYTLPTASTSTLGGVKVDGSSITINDGVISSNLPTASTSTLGGVKVDGDTITIANGVISASPSGPAISTATTTLTSSGWSNNSQTVNVTGVTASNIVIVTYAPTSKADYVAADIACTAQGSGTLTFSCDTAPSSNITVNVLVIDNTVSAAAGNSF